jgi:nitrate/nitrite transport system substrate-binding protein
VHRPDLYREVAKEMSLTVPSGDLKSETLFDGVAFDPADPERYAKSFAVTSIA